MIADEAVVEACSKVASEFSNNDQEEWNGDKTVDDGGNATHGSCWTHVTITYEI